jgi:hypothetical protein
LTAEGSPPSEITVPKNTSFSSTLSDGTTINFVTFDDNLLVDEGLATGGAATKILSGIVYIAQGYFSSQSWDADPDVDQRYVLTQPDIDTDFMTVTITEGTAVETWNYASNITSVTPTSTVYYLKEAADTVEMYFGNDVLGKKVSPGTLKAEYLVSRGEVANGLKVFSLVANVGAYDKGDFTISSVSSSTDGADREDIDSVKLLAPLSYQRQNRIVTVDDYKSIILERYGNVEAVHVWGGETSTPPQFGRVFISIKPKAGETISPTTQVNIEKNVLAKFAVVGIIPEIVDPDYTYINLNTTVFFNKDRTTLQSSQIKSLAAEEISEFFTDSVYDYEQSFKYSKLVSRIDGLEDSITHSKASLTLTKNLYPQERVRGTYSINFFNALHPGTMQTSLWQNVGLTNSQLKDDGLGNVDLYKAGVIVKKHAGTIDYSTGSISITLNPEMNVDGDVMAFTATPVEKDIDVTTNNLLILGTNTVSTSIVGK